MKNILLFMLFCFPVISFSQELKRDGSKEIFNLSEMAGMYCIVEANIEPMVNSVFVETSEGTFQFTEAGSNKKKRFNSKAHLLNFMVEYNWQFVDSYVMGSVFFVFKKSNQPVQKEE